MRTSLKTGLSLDRLLDCLTIDGLAGLFSHAALGNLSSINGQRVHFSVEDDRSLGFLSVLNGLAVSWEQGIVTAIGPDPVIYSEFGNLITHLNGQEVGYVVDELESRIIRLGSLNGRRVDFDRLGRTVELNGHPVLYSADGREISINGSQVEYSGSGSIIGVNGNRVTYRPGQRTPPESVLLLAALFPAYGEAKFERHRNGSR